MQRKYLYALIGLLNCVAIGAVVYLIWFREKADRDPNKPRLDIDFVGGTILVYEIDRTPLEHGLPSDDELKQLTEAIKNRLDPADIYNITVRQVGKDRIEIIVPGSANAGQGDGKVQDIKSLLSNRGRLEFRIVANLHDDDVGIDRAKEYFEKLDDAKKRQLEQAARDGLPPPEIAPGMGDFPWIITTRGVQRAATYSWVKLSSTLVNDLRLTKEAPRDLLVGDNWQKVDAARAKGLPIEVRQLGDAQLLIYSRIESGRGMRRGGLPEVEFFLLMRATDSVVVDGNRVRITANPTQDDRGEPAIGFSFNAEGGKQFHELTSMNTPDGEKRRQLGVILADELISFPTLRSAIKDQGIINGNFDQKQVDEMVRLLRSGQLPVPLKPHPVSETTVSPK